MRRKKKQQRLIAAAIALVVIIAAFFALRLTSSRQTAKSQTTTITVGSIGPDVQVWQHIAKSSQAKKLGLKIKVKAFTDGPSLLRATSDGSINVSAFASWAYLEAYNKSKSNTGQQVALATTYLEPMGIYSSKYKKLSDLPKGATIALAGNLNVLKDSLYHEKIDQSTKNNKLGKLYHNKQIQKWIAKKYSGTKVEVNKPVSYLTD